jgi:tRNA (guanine37-N1)-methyltransferase
MTSKRSSAPWAARVLTLFPQIFPGPLGVSLAGRGLREELWSLEAKDIRDYAADRHRTVDGKPAGGGPGMIMRPDILAAAIDDFWPGDERGGPLFYMSPRGEPFCQAMARELAAKAGVTILCGRFEGVDERLLQGRPIREVSVGDYVLAGGELAAMVVIEAAVRLLPGIVGSTDSLAHESHEGEGLLEYPQYTLPRIWEGREIPPVLLSGDHGAVEKWRRRKSLELTRRRRADLWRRYERRSDEADKDEIDD